MSLHKLAYFGFCIIKIFSRNWYLCEVDTLFCHKSISESTNPTVSPITFKILAVSICTILNAWESLTSRATFPPGFSTFRDSWRKRAIPPKYSHTNLVYSFSYPLVAPSHSKRRVISSVTFIIS